MLSFNLWYENNSTKVEKNAIRIDANKDKLEAKKTRIIKALIKNEKEPSNDFLLYIFVSPNLIPTIAANESEMLIINKEAIITSLLSNRIRTDKHPSK